ncbi:MAG: hypothetical protein HC859_03140 [Bacteroidia bacterium]|nr:hypothetical protein [Bacteroidia bacterium]
MTEKKKKPQNISTRWLGPLRWVLYALYGALFVALFAYLILHGDFFLILTHLASFGYGLYTLLRMATKLQQVAFDDEFLYVQLKRQELIIPLENIESVEIQTLGGVYKVNLYEAEQLGKAFFFKTSLLYPLNYKPQGRAGERTPEKNRQGKGKRQQRSARPTRLATVSHGAGGEVACELTMAPSPASVHQ